MISTLSTKEVNLGQDHTAEAGPTATWGAGMKAEDIATGVAEVILVTDHHPETTTDYHQETTTDHSVGARDHAQPPTTT